MSKLLTWRTEWSLGIGALDADHRALVEALIDISLRYCPQAAAPVAFPRGVPAPGRDAGTGRSGLAEALAAFGDKVRAHCRREEAFMRAIDYARRGEHEALHVALMEKFDAMVSDCRARGIHVFDDIGQEWVRDWLLGHIVGCDREFARVYFALVGLEGAQVRPGEAGAAPMTAGERK